MFAVVMKLYLVVACCFSINMCQAMLNNKDESIRLKLDNSLLCGVEQKELDDLIGEAVLYKLSDSLYQKVILGNKISGTDFYQVYIGGDKHKGIVCLPEKLYHLTQDCEK